MKKLYTESYLKIVEHTPELYALHFKRTDDPACLRKMSRFRRGYARSVHSRFGRYQREFNPYAVLCVH